MLAFKARPAAKGCFVVVSAGRQQLRQHRETFLARIQNGLVRLLARLRWARARYVISRSRIFDPGWYLATYREVGELGWDPAVHYLAIGAPMGLKPHLLFDPAWYIQKRVARIGNPLLDYVRTGARLGVDPSPYFSSRHYLATIGRPLRKGLSPLGDFIAYGAREAIIPTPLFDREWYLRNYPDVLRSGFDPFLHYVASGDREGRSPGPWFDASWYRMKNIEVRDRESPPLQHYLASGVADGRDPCGAFATQWYISHFGHEVSSTSEALLHYALQGRKAWHSTHPFLPPPGSSMALWEDLPWCRRDVARPEASRRALVIATDGGEWVIDACRRIMQSLSQAPDLDIFLLTWVKLDEVPEAIAVLEPGESLSSRRIVVTSRVLRALKFRDAKALAFQIGADPYTSMVVEELGLESVQVTLPLAQDGEVAIGARVGGTSPCSRKRPKVSAIVPNYNHARYLDERIGSILNQRVPPTEIIVLDDGSTDDSLAVLERWKRASPIPFTVVRNPQTIGSTFYQWAKGLGLVVGDLVWFAESDDASSPDFLECLVPYFADDRLSLAYAESQVVGAEREWLADSYRFYTDSISPTKWLSAYVEDGRREIDQALGIKNTIPNASAVLFRRSILSRHIRSVTAYRYCGDWWAYLCCLEDGWIAYHPEALNIHRRHAGSVTSTGEAGPAMLQEALRIKSTLWRSSTLSDRSRAMGVIQIFLEAQIRAVGCHRSDSFADALVAEWFAAAKDRTCKDLSSECRAFANQLISEATSLKANDREHLLASCDCLLARLWP
jgi:Glycosyl transferase family 2